MNEAIIVALIALAGQIIIAIASNNGLMAKLDKQSEVADTKIHGELDVMKNDMYPYMSDGEVLKKQEEEMKNLERKEEEKVRKKKQEEEMKKLEEEKRKREEIEEKNKIENILKQLPQEPSDDDPNKCTIMFRFPDGEKTVQRKFLKSDKVSLLYTYVKSLGREIYTENNENSDNTKKESIKELHKIFNDKILQNIDRKSVV